MNAQKTVKGAPLRAMAVAPERSERSLALEALWHSLPKDGAMPRRSALRPANAVRLLPYMTITEIEWEPEPRFRIHLVGTAFESRVQEKIEGQNFLDMLSPHHRPIAIETVRRMFATPCGIWQITPQHYLRKYAEAVEYTMLPLAGDGNRLPVVVNCVLPLPRPLQHMATGGKALAIDRSLQWAWLDIGCGVPFPVPG